MPRNSGTRKGSAGWTDQDRLNHRAQLSRNASVSAKTAREEFLQGDFPLKSKRLDIPGMTSLNVQRRSSHDENPILRQAINRYGIEIELAQRVNRRIGGWCCCIFPDQVTAVFWIASRFATRTTSLTGRNDQVPVPVTVRMATIRNRETIVVMEFHEMIHKLFVPVDVRKRKRVSVKNRKWSVPQRKCQAQANQYRTHHSRCREAELSRLLRHDFALLRDTIPPFSSPNRKRSRGLMSTGSRNLSIKRNTTGSDRNAQRFRQTSS